jgi:hypothetical protein
MLRHPVTTQLFWDIVKDLSAAQLESVPVLRLVEFVRIALDVSQPEFALFLYERTISHMIYNQTVLSNMSTEYLDRVNQIAK